jgi:hypothetical protein
LDHGEFPIQNASDDQNTSRLYPCHDTGPLVHQQVAYQIGANQPVLPAATERKLAYILLEKSDTARDSILSRVGTGDTNRGRIRIQGSYRSISQFSGGNG